MLNVKLIGLLLSIIIIVLLNTDLQIFFLDLEKGLV